jgi:hypothetical protein
MPNKLNRSNSDVAEDDALMEISMQRQEHWKNQIRRDEVSSDQSPEVGFHNLILTFQVTDAAPVVHRMK